MGGALAAFFTNGPEPGDDSKEAQQWLEIQQRIAGVVVVDVVEGTALEALPAMNDIVNNRPQSFPSMEMAIRWFTRTKAIHNLASAKVSVPGMLRAEGDHFVWRSNLVHSEPHWKGIGHSKYRLFTPLRLTCAQDGSQGYRRHSWRALFQSSSSWQALTVWIRNSLLPRCRGSTSSCFCPKLGITSTKT